MPFGLGSGPAARVPAVVCFDMLPRGFSAIRIFPCGVDWISEYLHLFQATSQLPALAASHPAGQARLRCSNVEASKQMSDPATRLDAVLADIDAANADDPRQVEADGVSRPFEIVYSDRMSGRLAAMYPEASELLRIAARAQHLRRFDIPRRSYPEGRAGYSDWRRACREHHARLVGEIMARHGYAAEDISRVGMLIRKERLKKDRDSQALENVVDVVFVEHYFDDFLFKYSGYDEDKIVDIVAKTLRKMSPKGHEAALALDLPERTRRLILAAAEREKDTLARLAATAVD
jgi:hypothetical protein